MLDFPLWKRVTVIVVCLAGVIFGFSNFLPNDVFQKVSRVIPLERVHLGLDLKGGVYLLYQADMDAVLKDRMTGVADSVKREFRDKNVQATQFHITSKALSFVIRSNSDIKKEVSSIIEDINPNLEIQVEKNNYTITLSSRGLKNIQRNVISQSIAVIRRRIDDSGTKEPIIQQQGNDRIMVQVPGASDPSEIKKLIGKTAKMTFHLVDSHVTAQDIASGNVPFQDEVLQTEDGHQVAVERPVQVSGERLTDAQATFQNGMPVVSFHFDTAGGRQFAEVTRGNVGRLLAIVLDNKVISSPRIDGPIVGGSGVIMGSFTPEETHRLAILLRAGALPAPLTIMQEQTVGPGLGHDSIVAGAIACVVGTALVFIFMLVYYGLFGVFADIALFFNIALLLACLSLLQATLTLPGIAGIVLTVGMAVDANVLSFERIREERRNGRKTLDAIEAGYKRAWSTVVDTNLTTLFAAFFLFIFGSGPVKGFATTLSIGILTSMFTSILVTRFFVALWFKRVRPKELPL